MKASEQATYIAKTKVSIAVGTPARVGKLLADGTLDLSLPTSHIKLHLQYGSYNTFCECQLICIAQDHYK